MKQNQVINIICIGKNSLWTVVVNLSYVCVQYVFHIPSWGSQSTHEVKRFPFLPKSDKKHMNILTMDIWCLISRSFFRTSRENVVSFACLWILSSLLLVSSILFLFTSPAHLKISSAALLWVIMVIYLLLWTASHTSVLILLWVKLFCLKI